MLISDRLKNAEREIKGAQEAVETAYGDLAKVLDTLKKMADIHSAYGKLKEFPKKPFADVHERLLSDCADALTLFGEFHQAWRDACVEFTEAAGELKSLGDKPSPDQVQ